MSTFVSRFKTIGADVCFVGLTLAVWAGQTFLVALGVILAVLLLATGCDGEILFSQLENLSRHYLSATAAARKDFDAGAFGVFVGLVTLLVLIRLPSLVARLRAELDRGSSHV